MKLPSEIVFKAFLNRLAPAMQQKLLRFIPEEKRAELQKTSLVENAADPKTWDSHLLLDFVHWSWFLAPLKGYSTQEQKCFLASLPGRIAEPLAKSLQLSPPFPPLTEVAQGYFREVLENSLTLDGEHPLPLACLPESKLEGLLHLSKKQLVHLVSLLALQDLAEEIRQTVDTKTLKKIISFLTEEEKKRLKEISSQKEPLILGKLPLENWDGSEETLRTLLHRRGLARLGLALAKEDPKIVWYICRQFDTGRAAGLLKISSKEISEEQSEWIIREIKELVRDYL